MSDTPPNIYFNEVKEQCESGDTKYGGIADWDDLTHNLSENCIPMDVFDMTSEDYREFLDKRRALMAVKIKQYYLNL